MRKFLILFSTAMMVLLLASGMSFAYTNFDEVPANTEPYSTERPPWLPPPAPQGDMTFFTVESDFKDAAGDLISEDYSCSAAEPGGVCSGPGPVNSATNDGCFNECLAAGFEFAPIPDGGPGDYAAVGTGFLGVGKPAVGPNTFVDEASWSFAPAVAAFGMCVIGDLINPVDVACTYQPSGAVVNIHGSLSGVFIGAVSAGEKITSVTCLEFVDGSADLYGALQFSPPQGGDGDPVPATGTWGVIALLGLLMVGSLYFMRRRAEAS